MYEYSPKIRLGDLMKNLETPRKNVESWQDSKLNHWENEVNSQTDPLVPRKQWKEMRNFVVEKVYDPD
ncbi:hypothetical protein ACROYT_G021281 [Oculina patagonica]